MKETKYFEELFNAGVKQEDAKTVLRQYLNAGAKASLQWKYDMGVYLVYLHVSKLEEPNEQDQISFVFGNSELKDSNGFVDEIGKNGEALSEGYEVFHSCERELLEAFSLTSQDIKESIYTF